MQLGPGEHGCKKEHICLLNSRQLYTTQREENTSTKSAQWQLSNMRNSHSSRVKWHLTQVNIFGGFICFKYLKFNCFIAVFTIYVTHLTRRIRQTETWGFLRIGDKVRTCVLFILNLLLDFSYQWKSSSTSMRITGWQVSHHLIYQRYTFYTPPGLFITEQSRLKVLLQMHRKVTR